jgi:glycosyltransferase involved in cell wall biosynthesis
VKKLLIWGPAPFGDSGYCRVVANLGPRLAKHFEVTYFSYTHAVGMPAADFKGLPVIFAPLNYPYPLRHYIVEASKMVQPDAVLQIFDLFTAYPAMQGYAKEMPLISYSPVDAIPLASSIKKAAELAKIVIPMCQWSKDVYEAGGIKCTEPIYHGVDTDVYYPRNKSEMKAKLGFPEDVFLVLMVQDNRVRKNIPNQIQAFLDFKKQTGAKAHLIGVIPNWVKDRAWDIPTLWEDLKRQNNSDECFTCMDGLPESAMPELYSAADVLLQCPHSEGFGLPIIEAGACGTPSICTDFGSMTELLSYGSDIHGWAIQGALDYWQPDNLGGWQMSPDREEITKALAAAYIFTDERVIYGKKALAWVLENCNWDKIAEKFKAVIESL